MKRICLLASLILLLGATQAQSAYKHSIGITVGNFQALSYKTFLSDHLAFQLDLGTKISTSAVVLNFNHQNTVFKPINVWSFELNPNLMYQGHFTQKFTGFVGGGISLGYAWYLGHTYSTINNIELMPNASKGKFGANAILGLEYTFNAPITMQLDVRPGYSLIVPSSKSLLGHYFDWSVNLGIRYTLQ